MLITAAAGLAFVTLVLANVAVWFAGMHVSTDVSAFLDVGYDAEGVNLDLELKIKNPNAFMVEVLPFDLNVSFCISILLVSTFNACYLRSRRDSAAELRNLSRVCPTNHGGSWPNQVAADTDIVQHNRARRREVRADQDGAGQRLVFCPDTRRGDASDVVAV
eukprot:TRINITY_DN8817_c0_g1_i1.p1 TRINITY_DN8817_c0_g1~~TRINITY_DN8817_c0_g1_i1.p1  ORF type:complete len:162 (+),score=21.40 TRINITY_DN8817_c0_g1_i1:8-493(+)